jgi:hypothetical protein
MIRKINQFYDRIPEPFRFLLFLAIIIPGIVLMAQDDPLHMRIGLTYLLLLLFIRIYPRIIK